MRRYRIAGLSFATAAILPLVFVAGCSHQSPLVGKWTNTTRQYTQVMKLGADGSWSTDASSSLSNSHLTMTGTYESDQSTITVHQIGTVLNGVRRPLTSQIAAPQVFQYTLDGNTLNLSAGGQRQMKFTRAQ